MGHFDPCHYNFLKLDFERDTQFHGVVVARIEFSLKETEKQQLKGARIFSEPIARAAVSGLISAA